MRDAGVTMTSATDCLPLRQDASPSTIREKQLPDMTSGVRAPGLSLWNRSNRSRVAATVSTSPGSSGISS